MKLSKLIRELSVARDKIKVDPEVGVLSKQTEFTLKFEGNIEQVICAKDNINPVLLILRVKDNE